MVTSRPLSEADLLPPPSTAAGPLGSGYSFGPNGTVLGAGGLPATQEELNKLLLKVRTH